MVELAPDPVCARAVFVIAALLASGVAAGETPGPSAERLLAHIRTLSSDEFEGRAPGSAGERKTLDYLEEQLRVIGLEPAAPGGGYRQKVPLVGITADPSLELVGRSAGGAESKGRYGTDFVAWTKRIEPTVAIDAPVVFAGYGVDAPEFRWDDFGGLDLRGKLLLVLVGDPPSEDGAFFGGRALTYYGRWTYKLEKATALGAAGCLIIHDDEAAGYPWSVVAGGWSGEQFDLAAPDRNAGRLAVEGWLSSGFAERWLRSAGQDLGELRTAARRQGFRAVDLPPRARLEVRNKLREVTSANLVARVPGVDAERRHEAVVASAHWDHLGKNEAGIHHGAVDNASGVAAALEIGRAAAALDPRPARSLVFLLTTAEEQGLLGARFHALHPAVALEHTAAIVNLDGLPTYGRTRDVVMIGRGQSALDEIVDQAAALQQRVVTGDPEPEKGYFFRSDHLPFLQAGIPAFFPHPGIEVRGRPPGWGLAERKRYIEQDYHRPSDVVRPDWDLSGAVEDAELALEILRRVADAPAMPAWKAGAAFARAGAKHYKRPGE